MKQIFLFAGFTFFSLNSFGQNTDSIAVQNAVDSLIEVSRAFVAENNFDKALEVNEDAEKLVLKKLGQETAAYGSTCYNHGRVLYFKGDYPEAEKWYLKSKTVRAKVLGKEHPDYAWSLNNLGMLYHDEGDYAAAEQLYLEAKAIRAKAMGKDHPVYAMSLGNLAILYSDKGEYDKAEPLNLEAKEIWAKVMGLESNDYSMILNNLGDFYRSKGEFEKAELLFLESKEIKAKIWGKDDPDYALAINNLGILYFAKGDYYKAEPLYLEAKDIIANSLGKENREYAGVLNNLAELYSVKNDFAKAESIYLEAIEILAKNKDKDHPKALNNLALLYTDNGYYSKAEPLFQEAKEIWEKAFGKLNPDYAAAVNGQAHLFYLKGNYSKAETLFLEAKDIRTKTLGKQHPDYATTISDITLLYNKTNRIPEATAAFLEINKLNRLLIEKAAAYSSENEMISYLNIFKNDVAKFHSFAQSHNSPELCRETYNNSLFYNGLVLENERLLARAIAGADSLTRDIYIQWQGCHRRLAKRYARPIAENKAIASVELEAEGYEKQLMRQLPGFQKSLKIPNWQEVRDQLQPEEAAVEFIHYRFYRPEKTDSTMYAAMLLRPGWDAPKFIPLFEEKSLDSLLNTSSQRKADYVAHLYALEDRGIVVAGKPHKTLYEMIWEPLEKELRGASAKAVSEIPVKKVYFAPSGLLHRLNLAAIPISSDSTLANRYNLIELGSTRQLLNLESSKFSNNDALLYGGIQYDLDSNQLLSNPPPSATRAGAWNYLKWTEKEVDALFPILSGANFQPQIRKGFDATEESFKIIGKTSPSPRVLHLATHGFFFPDPTEGDTTKLNEWETGFKTSHNPLVRSGLLMAGANYNWKSGKPFKKGMENGILTAYEISHMDLTNTELVVLSACETGLGDIKGSEGVYGLQRAFKIAGAKYLIMSLWQVPDFQTKELMTTFYGKWLAEKMAIPEAFHAAQQEMREKYENPYFWAGFVLVE